MSPFIRNVPFACPLYWQGYKGRFGMLSWPTEWVDTSGASWRNPTIPDIAWDPKNFDRSEQKAWNSAFALRSLLGQLHANYDTDGGHHVNLFAHSMGNIVASEALRLEATSPNPQKLVHTYVASQAAVPAEAYDSSVPHNLRDSSALAPRFLPDDQKTDYANFRGTGKAYFADLGNAADQLVNFFNPQDYATNGSKSWPMNQATKPDLGYDELDDGRYVRDGFLSTTFLNLANPQQRYEAFSFAGEPQSKALGAQPNVGGPFLGSDGKRRQLDLSTELGLGANFTQRQWDHSAQFNGTNMVRWHYWDALLKAFGLKT